MDMVKIGRFLAELRRENHWTQEQLGEKIGVTNKTVSRWETGTYLPPVDMLQALCGLYGVSLNEILSGERLQEAEYRKKAEENIQWVLSKSAFTLQERMQFFKKKWEKEHRFEMVLEMIVWLAGIVCGFLFYQLLVPLLALGGFIWSVYQYNRMMAYVERRAFENPADGENAGKSS